MNRDDLKGMYGSVPESFQNRMAEALAAGRSKNADGCVRVAGRHGLRVALISALIVVMLAAVAVAAFSSQVAEFFGRFYGNDMREELLNGDIAQSGQSIQVGDAVYTLDEVVYIDDGLYGIGRITPAANANVVLMAEDFYPSDAAGYGLHYGEESRAPEGAPTYAEVAAQKGAKLLQAKAVAEAVGVDEGGIIDLGTVGYTQLPQRDGSILFTFELSTGIAVEKGDTYAIRLWVDNWEVTPGGEWLRDEPNDTYLGQDWIVEVQPKPAKEGQIR